MLGLTGVAPLVRVYSACILIELSLKEHLGLVTTSGNGGHNLPALIHQLGLTVPAHAAACNALKTQLTTALGQFYSQGINGQPQPVPASSYPYLRYVRHSADWSTSCCLDADIINLGTLVDRIIHFLQHDVGVSV